VMIGDSLTEIWGLADPKLFGARIVNRGISGQTSPQILLRFMADVVDLKPKRVHILCGGNDIAGNTGPNLPEDFQRNIRAMADLAKAAGIDVLLASELPANVVPWNPEARPLEFIPLLNNWLRAFAAERGLTYVDYHSALVGDDQGLQPQFSADGIHVTRAAYRAMRTILESHLSAR
jgi:lysophospholipase L1-like esterase